MPSQESITRVAVSSTRCSTSTSCAHLEPCWPPCPSVTSTYSTTWPNTASTFTQGQLGIAAWLTGGFWDNDAAPQRPFRVADLSGLDIAWRMRQSTAAQLHPDIGYAEIAYRLCEQDRLGQKTGQRWYRYVKASPTCTRIQPLTNSSTHSPGVKHPTTRIPMPISCVGQYSDGQRSRGRAPIRHRLPGLRHRRQDDLAYGFPRLPQREP